jgi:hypothetical protein
MSERSEKKKAIREASKRMIGEKSGAAAHAKRACFSTSCFYCKRQRMNLSSMWTLNKPAATNRGEKRTEKARELKSQIFVVSNISAALLGMLVRRGGRGA